MEDQTRRDSLGSLRVSLPALSASSETSKPRNSNQSTRRAGPAVLRLIARIARLRGEPWGRDEGAADEFANDWELVLGGVSADALEKSVTEFLKRPGSKWPQPGDLFEIAKKFMPEQTLGPRHSFSPVYDYNCFPDEVLRDDGVRRLIDQKCNPDYIRWYLKDRLLTREMVVKVKAMTEEDLKRLGIDDYSLRVARKIIAEPGLDDLLLESTPPQGA